MVLSRLIRICTIALCLVFLCGLSIPNTAIAQSRESDVLLEDVIDSQVNAPKNAPLVNDAPKKAAPIDNANNIPASPASDFDYSIKNNEVTINDYIGGDTEIVVPNTIDGYPVVTYDTEVSTNKNKQYITKVTFPANIRSIWSCDHNACRVQEYIFDTNNSTFASVDGVIFTKNMKTLIRYPIGNTRSAYSVPDGVTSMTQHGMKGSLYLQQINIPASVTRCWDASFTDCEALDTINVSSGNTVFAADNGLLYSKDKTMLLCYPPGRQSASFTVPGFVTTIANYAFLDNKYITEIVVPNGVTKIGGEYPAFWQNVTGFESSSFSGCSKLVKVTLPESVTELCGSAFSGCTSLTSVNIPSKVTKLNDSLFSACTSLKSISIPAQITSIGSGVFGKCSAIESIEVDAGNAHFVARDGVLFTRDFKTLLQYPAGKKISSYSIPEGTQTIASDAFCGVEALEHVVMPDSVTEAGYGAFSLSGLKSIRLSDRLTEISNSMFHSTNISQIWIPSSVKFIDAWAFNYCNKLRFLAIPNGIEKLGYRILQGAMNVKAIIIPPSVKEVVGGELSPYSMPNSTIYGTPNSYAQQFAASIGMPFKEYIEPQSIAFRTPNLVLKLDTTSTLALDTAPENALKDAVFYSSDNRAVSVDGSGKISADALGTATIKAITPGGKTAVCTVTVVTKDTPIPDPSDPNAPSSIKTLKTLYLEKGKTALLPYAVYPASVKNKRVKWSITGKKGIVTVSASGKVTAKKTGTANVQVKTANNKRFSCKVTVVNKKSAKKMALKAITLNRGTRVSIANGRTMQLTVATKPTKAVSVIPKWASSNKSVAAIDQLGKVTAKKVGSTTITVVCGKIKKRLVLTVK